MSLQSSLAKIIYSASNNSLRVLFSHCQTLHFILKISCIIVWYAIHVSWFFELILCFSFIQAIFIAPLQVHYYSEALPIAIEYCVGVSRQSATGE